MISNLPPESATYRGEAWTMQDELAAALIEHVDMWARNFASIQGVKPRALPSPVRIPRPGEDAKPNTKVMTDPRAIAAWFARNA